MAEPVGGEGKVDDSAEKKVIAGNRAVRGAQMRRLLRMHGALYIVHPASRREIRGFENSVWGSTADVLLKVIDSCRLCRDEPLNHVAD
jgi:hypothetical protein